jgi:hypothetical protein
MACSATGTTVRTSFRHALAAAAAAFALLFAPLAPAADSSASHSHHSAPQDHGHHGHYGDGGGVEHGLASCGHFSCAPGFVAPLPGDILPHLAASSGCPEADPDRLAKSLSLNGDPPVPRSRFS